MRGLTLRARLALVAVASAAVALAVLIAAFNLVLDARLRANTDNLLRERAATALRGLAIDGGALSVVEAPDLAAVDEQTWIFRGAHPLEQPSRVSPRKQAAVLALVRRGSGFATDDATDTRLLATPVRAGPRAIGTVVVGSSLNTYESSASSALVGSAILGAVMLAATASLLLWLLGKALRPVAEMTEKADEWGEHDLSRRFFAGEPRDELSALAAVLDRLLGRLAHSLRREQQLTAEISHELRTPLSKIVTATELATSRPREATEYREALALVRRQADELQRAIETLLASARAGGEGGDRSANAREAALRAAHAAGDVLGGRGKSVEVVGASSLRVGVAPDIVERVLLPLLENAARYGGDRIEVGVHANGPYVVFEVRDDGPGVGPADRERIFDPGYRGADGAAKGPGGAGLGLPLVRRLARAAGGDVEARGSQEGACFAVRLPAA